MGLITSDRMSGFMPMTCAMALIWLTKRLAPTMMAARDARTCMTMRAVEGSRGSGQPLSAFPGMQRLITLLK